MLINNRVILDQNGTLTDLSIALSTIQSQTVTLDYESTTDYLYIGSDMPFNHRHFELSPYTPGAGVQASLVIQDLTITFDDVGAANNAYTIEYTDTVLAGSESASVLATAITVEIESGVSTATQVKAALDALLSPDITVTITGTAGNPQLTDGPESFTGGEDAGSALLQSTVSVDLWTGNTWVPAIDIIDQTSVSGSSLAQSGVIAWRPDEDESSWNWDDTDDMPASGLQTLKIKQLYWARLSWSSDFDSTAIIKYLGYKFTTDAELESEYPELSLSSLKTAFKAGKTDWNEQILVASEYIIQDLRQMNVITSMNQILDWRTFAKAAVHKTAEIIFRAFGDDYANNLIEANREYKKSLQLKQYNVDLNRDATLTEVETKPITTFLTR